MSKCLPVFIHGRSPKEKIENWRFIMQKDVFSQLSLNDFKVTWCIGFENFEVLFIILIKKGSL